MILRDVKWQYVHERDAELIRRDGMMCETHPGVEFGHDPNCGGPGMAWIIEGRRAIEELAATSKVRAGSNRGLTPAQFARIYPELSEEERAECLTHKID